MRIAEPEIKDLKNCTECGSKVVTDIFSRPKEKGKGRLLEARACLKCDIIFEIICD